MFVCLSAQSHDTLTMLRHRKHIHRLNRIHAVFLRQRFQVACQRVRTAGDINHFFRLCTADGIQKRQIGTAAGRIHDQYIGCQIGIFQEEFTGITAIESSVCNFVVLGVGLFVAFFVLEFLIPLFLRNGQTIGKKMFGIGVMQDNGVKLKNVSLFVRSILGKYTVETMIPVSILLMIVMGQADIFCLFAIVVIAILEIVFLIRTNTNSALHDVLSSSVTIDLASQKIFESDEELMEYKKKIAEQKANEAAYF